MQIINFLLSEPKILTKVGDLFLEHVDFSDLFLEHVDFSDFFHERIDLVDHGLHHVGISLVCTFIA